MCEKCDNKQLYLSMFCLKCTKNRSLIIAEWLL